MDEISVFLYDRFCIYSVDLYGICMKFKVVPSCVCDVSFLVFIKSPLGKDSAPLVKKIMHFSLLFFVY